METRNTKSINSKLDLLRIKYISKLSLQLFFIYIIAVAMRMVPEIVAGQKLPFWDPISFYEDTLLLLTKGTLPSYFPGLYFLYGFISLLTGIPLYWLCKYLPPVINAFTIFPIYLLGKEVTGKREVGLLSALLFAILEICALRQSYYVSEGIALFFIPLLYFLLIHGAKLSKFNEYIVYSVLAVLALLVMVIYHFPAALMAAVPVIFFVLLYLIRLKAPPKALLIFSLITILGLVAFLTYSQEGATYFNNYVLGQIQGVMLVFVRIPNLSLEKLFSEQYALTLNPSIIFSMFGSYITIILAFATIVLFLVKRRTNLFLLSWFFVTAIVFAGSLLIDLAFGATALTMPEIGGGGFWIYPYRAWVYIAMASVIPASLGIWEFYERFENVHIEALIIEIFEIIMICSVIFEVMFVSVYLPTSSGL
jgi:hypothetical protein